MRLARLLNLTQKDASLATSAGSRPWRGNEGFTLVELLVVTAIVGILTLLAVPALSSLSNSGNVNAAAGGVSLLLNQARAYAMAHNTYVWVGFSQNSSQQLVVGVVAGTTGQSTDLISGTAAKPNYAPVSKLQIYDHLELSSSITASPNTGLSLLATPADDISQSQPSTIGSFQQIGGGTNVNFNSDVLEFTPRGEAELGANDGSHWIQIGLQPIRGGNATNPNVVVLQVATLTGLVNVFRQ